MPENAEAHSATLTINRNCTVELTDVSSVYCLVNPKVHMESGFSHSPLCAQTRLKCDNAASGTVGVLTYEPFDMRNRCCDGIMAIMFSVPFDYNLYKNWLAVGISEQSGAVDSKLFSYMYNDKNCSDFVRYEANGSGAGREHV